MKCYPRLLILFLGISGACDNYPKDPEKTLEKITNSTLVVGYSANPPWVVPTDSIPTGLEPDLVRDFAKSRNAKIEWKNDTEQNLFEDLEQHKVHLVIAGLTDDSPWKTKVALTRSYAKEGKKKHVLAAIQGENAFIVALEEFLHAQEKQMKAPAQP